MVYNVDPSKLNEFKGIRIHETVSYVVTKKIKTQKCPERIENSIVHLAVGPAYEINVEPSTFAKSERTVKRDGVESCPLPERA